MPMSLTVSCCQLLDQSCCLRLCCKSNASMNDTQRQTILSHMLCLQELKAEPAAQHQVAHVKQERSAGPDLASAWPPQSRQPLSSHQVEASLAALRPAQGQHAYSQQSRVPPQQQLGLAPQSHQQPQQAQHAYPSVPAWEPRGPASPHQQGMQPQQQLGRMQDSFPGSANSASAHLSQTNDSMAQPAGPAAIPAWHAGSHDAHLSQGTQEAYPGPPNFPQQAGASAVGPGTQHGNVVTSWQGASGAARSYPYQQRHQPAYSTQQPAPPYPAAPAMPPQPQPAAGGQPAGAVGPTGFGLSPELLNSLKDLAPALQQLQQPPNR